jgi:lipoate-protein ligase B
MSESSIAALRLGRVPYRDALAVQRTLHRERKAGTRGDTIILVEHDPVLTLGRGADRRHILADDAHLTALGIEVIPVERGGDVTYHGPGQLVAYPILDLTAYGRDIHRYVCALEESAIRLLALYGVAGTRRAGLPGVWAGPRKLASVGVFVSRWVTLHGIAINIDPDLSHFDLIHPCGLTDTRMTSLAAETGHPIALAEVEETYLAILIDVINKPRVTGSISRPTPMPAS